MKVDYDFGEILMPGHYMIVPIVLGEAYGENAGTIKHLHVHPGKKHPTLLELKFEKTKRGTDRSGKNRLRKVELLESKIDGGCFLLLEKYDEEKFPEGRRVYEKWMEGTRPRKDGSGRKVARSRGRPFPIRLLPKAVLELRENAARVVKEAFVDENVVHPADRKGKGKAA